MAEEQTLQARVQNLFDTEENWKTIEDIFVPKPGEVVIYAADSNYDYPRTKIGDYNGTILKNLPFTYVKFIVDSNLTMSGQAADAEVVGTTFNNVNTNIDEIKTRLDELEYKPITINSFTNNVGTVEMGSTVTSVKLDWTTSKTPKTLTLNGTTLDVNLKTYTYNDLNLTKTTSYKLVVTDNRGASVNKTSYVNFYNRICYGVAEEPETINSDFVMSLATKTLSNSRTNSNIKFTAGSGEYIWYCVPKRLGECTFTDIETGLGAGLSLVATIEVTNSSNYTEDYYVYRSDYPSLGSLSIKIS